MVKKLSMLVLALVSISAAQVSHASLVGAKSVHITSHNNDWIQISEVVAMQAGTNWDVARDANGGTAYAPNNYSGSAGPGAAIDGVVSTDYPNIYHSGGTGPGNYLDISFASPANLELLLIYGRNGCCQDRDIYDVTIFDAFGAQLWAGVMDDRYANGQAALVNFGPDNTVPEPSGIALLSLALGGLGIFRRKKV